MGGDGMSVRIANNDISVVMRGYAIAQYPIESDDPDQSQAEDNGQGKDKSKRKPAAKPAARPDQVERENVLVWADLAPAHPKAVGAIWATLVNGTGAFLEIYDRDSGQRHRARGLNRRYERLQSDSPRLAGRVRPKGLRLIAPECARIDDYTRPFVVIDWPGLSTKAASDLLAEWGCAGNASLQVQLECGLPSSTALAAMLELGSPYAMRIEWGEYLLAEAVARGYARPLITGGRAPQGYLIDPAPWPDLISAGIKRGVIALA